jgi:hypothetical protein
MSMRSEGQRYDTTQIDAVKPQEEWRRKKHSARLGRIPRWVYKIILILILCVFIMLIWFNRGNLNPSNVLEWVQNSVVGMGIGDGFPTKINGNTISIGNFKSVNKEIVTVSDTALTIMNSTAKEIVGRQHSFSNPVMKLNGPRTLIYNLGGKGYQLEGQSGTLVKANAEQNILAGALANNGRYALVTQAEGYFGQLTAYTPDHKDQSRYWFSEYYPTAAALNQDGTRAVVTGVSAKDGGLTSAVYVLNLNEEKAVQPFAVYSDNILFDASYSDEGIAIAVGDRFTSVINVNQKSKTEFPYQGNQLTAYSVDASRAALSLAPYEDSANSRVVVLDKTGKAAVSLDFKQKVKSVSLYGDTVAALAQGKVYFYSATTGNSLGSCDAGSDAKAIALHDESSVYILGVSEIRLASSR